MTETGHLYSGVQLFMTRKIITRSASELGSRGAYLVEPLPLSAPKMEGDITCERLTSDPDRLSVSEDRQRHVS